MTCKLKSAGAAALIAATLWSCETAELEAPIAYETTITAVLSGADEELETKTCIDMSNTGRGYLGLLWQEGDQIGVFGESTTANALFSNPRSGNSARTEFSGTMTGGDAPHRAYYPYSKDNDGKSINALTGTVLDVQPFDSQSGRLVSDYKYGAPVVAGSREFTFKHLFSMLRVSVDATGTALAGEKLLSVEISVKDAAGQDRAICGTFNFSAEDGSWSNLTDTGNSVLMPWTDIPTLNTTHTGFLTVLPTVKAGDKISVTVISEGHKARLTADCKVDFEQEQVYNIPLTLSSYAANPSKYAYSVVSIPKFNSFSFAVSKNSGKLLNNQLVWNSSNNPQFNSVTSHSADVSGSEVKLTIPYLYNFTLVPDFTVTSGTTVSVNGVTQTSGVTAVDFTNPVTYTLTANGESRDYTVTITNTGLPVVVLNQSSTGTKGTTFVNFRMRSKDEDWVEDDMMMIYNPDGTVDMDTTYCGSRLRGNTSALYPKKPFALKFVEKKKVLGMPKHKRWVLLANWLDHSMIRNAVAFDIAHAIEDAWKTGAIDEGIPWNVHGQNVELIVDGHHVGNYYLCEQIKIGGSRLDIQDCYEDVLAAYQADPTKPAATFENCGYLLELDNNYDEDHKFKTTHYQIPFMFKDLVDGNTGTIFNAVKSKVQGIEDNIYNKQYSAAYNNLDINSVIDQWLIWELTMNHEVLDPRSVYFFMDGNGKLSAGPVWDFDRATFQNPTAAQSQGSSGDRVKPFNKWVCWSATSSMPSAFFPQLVDDPIFQAKVQERWAVMYPYLQGVVAKIREYGETQAVSFTYDSAMWPTKKAAIQKHKTNFSDWSGDEELDYYEDVIDNFVYCYTSRLNAMNTLITSGTFSK
ncbi:MAG: CotH kinase family protein [Bacteroidales bacterium]|nr:CotH kinase family protein [Bacteroidales bacterium]